MAFVRFPAEKVAWSIPTDTFASSNVVVRGFCAHCGTPLTYQEVGGRNISVALNSLDEPGAFRPTVGSAADQKAPWLSDLDKLAMEVWDLTASPGFINHQCNPPPSESQEPC